MRRQASIPVLSRRYYPSIYPEYGIATDMILEQQNVLLSEIWRITVLHTYLSLQVLLISTIS